ncbi:MAG: hypothetical protein ACRBBN_00525 [Methyloligellaceae bacterium]
MNRTVMRFIALFTIVFAMVVSLNANASSVGSQSGVLAFAKKNNLVTDPSDATPLLVKHHRKSKGKKYKKRKYYGGKYRGRKWRGKRYRGRHYRRHRRYRHYRYSRCHRARRRCAWRYGWHTYRWRRCVRRHGCYYRGPRVRFDPFPFPFPY